MAISSNVPPPSTFEYFAIFTLDNSRGSPSILGEVRLLAKLN